MQTNSADYYRARERAERKAAEEAMCPEARRAHEEMAQAYALLVSGPDITTLDLSGSGELSLREIKN